MGRGEGKINWKQKFLTRSDSGLFPVIFHNNISSFPRTVHIGFILNVKVILLHILMLMMEGNLGTIAASARAISNTACNLLVWHICIVYLRIFCFRYLKFFRCIFIMNTFLTTNKIQHPQCYPHFLTNHSVICEKWLGIFIRFGKMGIVL